MHVLVRALMAAASCCSALVAIWLATDENFSAVLSMPFLSIWFAVGLQ